MMKFRFVFSLILILISILFYSCKKNCDCMEIVYQSNNSNNYSNVEISRNSTDLCNEDSLFSTYLDSNQNISFVTTVIECDN